MMGADEEKTVRLIQGLQREIKELVEEFEGRVVGTAGDSGASVAKTSPSGACRWDGFVRWTSAK